jgi:hypothetical protein
MKDEKLMLTKWLEPDDRMFPISCLPYRGIALCYFSETDGSKSNDHFLVQFPNKRGIVSSVIENAWISFGDNNAK